MCKAINYVHWHISLMCNDTLKNVYLKIFENVQIPIFWFDRVSSCFELMHSSTPCLVDELNQLELSDRQVRDMGDDDHIARSNLTLKDLCFWRNFLLKELIVRQCSKILRGQWCSSEYINGNIWQRQLMNRKAGSR